MKRFNDFINEAKKEDKNTFEKFLKDIKTAFTKDFKRDTPKEAEAFVTQYEQLLKDAFENGYTVREAIASTKIPGHKVSNDKVDESYVFEIDTDFEETYKTLETLNRETQLVNAEQILDNYFQKYSKKNFSDERIFERVKNNYITLKKLYELKSSELVDSEPQKEMDLKIYDINTWKYAMYETDRRLGIILGIESKRTGSALTKQELDEIESKDQEYYTRLGYKAPERHANKPNWYKHMDIRFNVRVKGGGEESWHIKKILPLTEERFFALGGEEYPKREYKNNSF